MKNTMAVISVNKHKKAKIIASIISVSLLQFYENAIDCYINSLANDNKIVKSYIENKEVK